MGGLVRVLQRLEQVCDRGQLGRVLDQPQQLHLLDRVDQHFDVVGTEERGVRRREQHGQSCAVARGASSEAAVKALGCGKSRQAILVADVALHPLQPVLEAGHRRVRGRSEIADEKPELLFQRLFELRALTAQQVVRWGAAATRNLHLAHWTGKAGPALCGGHGYLKVIGTRDADGAGAGQK